MPIFDASHIEEMLAARRSPPSRKELATLTDTEGVDPGSMAALILDENAAMRTEERSRFAKPFEGPRVVARVPIQFLNAELFETGDCFTADKKRFFKWLDEDEHRGWAVTHRRREG